MVELYPRPGGDVNNPNYKGREPPPAACGSTGRAVLCLRALTPSRGAHYDRRDVERPAREAFGAFRPLFAKTKPRRP